MRVAALYDVHGNLAALEAVLAELEGDTHVVSGGDLVAGEHGRECLERLSALGEHRVSFIRGNADREVAELASIVDDWPPGCVLGPVGRLGTVNFCHATIDSDESIITRATPDDVLRATFPRGLTVVGHTHVQFDRTAGDVRVVNAGSVGMPYESEPGAYWALLGDDVELRRTSYAGASLDLPGAEEATAYFESLRGA